MDALSLMMDQADEIFSGIAGQPKPDNKRSKVDKGSTALVTKDMEKLQQNMGLQTVNTNISSVTDNSVHRSNVVSNAEYIPKAKNLEEAFEQYFRMSAMGFEHIAFMIRDSSEQVARLLYIVSEWFEWAQKRAFLEDNRHQKQDIYPVLSDNSSTGGGSDGGSSLDIGGRRRNKNGTYAGRDKDKNRKRTPKNPGNAGDTSTRRKNPKTRPMPNRDKPDSRDNSRTNRFGRRGAVLGALLTGTALVGGAVLGQIQKRAGSTELGANTEDPSGNLDISQVEAPVAPASMMPTPTTATALPTPVSAIAPKTELPQTTGPSIDPASLDMASTSMMGAGMLAGAARLPGIGTALQVGSGAIDMYGIAQDDTLTKSEKSGQMAGVAASTAAVGTGAIIGGIIGTALIPIPGVGTVLGSLAGSFLGSLAGDKLSENVSEYVSTKIVVETEAAIADSEKERKKVEQKEAATSLARLQVDPVARAASQNQFATTFGLSQEPARVSMSSVFSGGGGGTPKGSLNKTGNYEENLGALRKAMKEANITDPTEMAMFLGQMHHESGGMKTLEENLNYSAEGYIKTFKGRNGINTKAQAAALIGQGKEAQAEAMYGGEWGKRNLGNSEKGDGHKFRGRGLTQLTGRSNYARAGKALGIDLVANPDLASDPEIAAKIATWFWQDRDGLAAAGKAGDIEAVTKKINGGKNGLADRVNKTALYAADIKSGKFSLEDAPMVAKNAEPAIMEVAKVEAAPSRVPPASIARPPIPPSIARLAPAPELADKSSEIVSREPLARAAPQSTVPTMMMMPQDAKAQPAASNPAPNLARQPTSNRGSSGNAAVPSLDVIPVMIDDPTMGMLNIGYI